MRTFIQLIAVTATMVFCSSARSQSTPALDSLIPPAQQAAMGLQKLTNEEREALRQHIVALLTAANIGKNDKPEDGSEKTNSVALVVPSGTSATTFAGLLDSQITKGASKGKASAGNTYPTPSGGHWVKDNISSGEFIRLEDGSLWQIDRLDTIDTRLWLTTDEITVLDAKNGPPGFDYILLNTDDEEKAHAKLISR